MKNFCFRRGCQFSLYLAASPPGRRLDTRGFPSLSVPPEMVSPRVLPSFFTSSTMVTPRRASNPKHTHPSTHTDKQHRTRCLGFSMFSFLCDFRSNNNFDCRKLKLFQYMNMRQNSLKCFQLHLVKAKTFWLKKQIYIICISNQRLQFHFQAINDTDFLQEEKKDVLKMFYKDYSN